MVRAFVVVLCVLGLIAPVAADEAKGEKVEFTSYTDYFEKNNSGLKGDSSYLVFPDRGSYDKVFSLRPPLMGKKSTAIPADAFEKMIVVAAIKRGNSITTYVIDKASVDGDTLFLQYKATAGKASTATFASPMIVTVGKGKITKVAFIENEKTVATLDVGKTP